MVQFAAILLRGVIATFLGLLIAGGTLTFAADRATVQRPTLVPVAPPAPDTLQVPDVTGQAYVFAKGILQDHGFAWHVAGVVQGFAANTVATQQPTPGTTVLDTGAPTITLTLARNPAYDEHGTPENDAPYPGTAIKLPANVPLKPVTNGPARAEPVPVPQSVLPSSVPAAPTVTTPAATPTSAPTMPAVTTPPPAPAATPTLTPVTTPAVTPVTPVTTPTVTPVTTPTVTPVTSPAPVSNTPRAPDFAVPGAPKEPVRTQSLPDRVAALAAWMESHHDPSARNLNHWLYEHAYIVAGARFGWWHGAQALQALIEVDRRAEALWGVGSQSRTTAQKALAEVRSRAG
jgi:hypothetical protein